MGKYAVIVGINYIKDPEAALAGCCNDARIMQEVVKSKGFKDRNIRMLVDDDDSVPDPTGRELKKALKWLVSNRKHGDVLFFHFSGHGTQIPDVDGDEADRKDEAICLEGMFLMVDDDLKEYFSNIPDGVNVTVVMDCCHSGSMLDGELIAIDGEKGGGSSNEEVSDTLLAILGGTRSDTPRSLPIETVLHILSGHAGHEVDIGGIHGVLAELFGSNSGKLGMVASALFEAMDIYEFSDEEYESTDGEDDYGYDHGEGDGEEDVGVLITGCQAHETSADVRTKSGDAFGALTKTLSSVVAADSGISYYDLVSQVRSHLADKGFSQNPCLECHPADADRRFIC